MFKRDYLKLLVRPKQSEPESRQQELILNILLTCSIAGFIILNLIRTIDLLTIAHDRGLPIVYTVAILLFFIFLLWLSKKGCIKTAAWLLIIAYSAPMFYSFILWGTDLPAALLLAVLIITLSGILISADLVLINTAVISIFLIILTYLQSNKIIAVASFWRSEPYELGDAIAYSVLLMIIAIIAWLFARGIGRALKRAYQSEAELKKERDSLEIRVVERTNQLRQSEAEKLNQLYRLAEFGRLSSGIFHDLVNPLTAISLNLEQINEKNENNKIINAKSSLNQALIATHKMEGLIASIKKQIQLESHPNNFSLNEEVEQIIQMFSYKARRANVRVTFLTAKKIELYGDPIKFWQVISNLLANAIEASEISANPDTSGVAKDQEIIIELGQQNNLITLSVKDNGSGIRLENLNKIFEPFFSTKKSAGQGLGLGLSSTKNIIEKYFAGTITVSSELGQGSIFMVSLPLNQIKNAD
jgi:signal transduction histidine kinase